MQPEPEVDALSRSSTLKVTLSAAQQLAIVESPTGTGSAFPVEVPFVNKLGEPVEIMWYDNDGGQKRVHSLAKEGAGASIMQQVIPGDGAWCARTGTAVKLLVSSTAIVSRGHFVVGQDTSESWVQPVAGASLAPSEAAVAKTFRINRNSVFKQYCLDHGWRAAEPGERAQLAHWDTYKVGPANAEIDCWPRSATNCIDNIWTYYQRVFDAGLTEDFPQTFFDWRILNEATIASSPIWFLKDVWGVNGKGITLIATYADYKKAIAGTPKKPTFLTGPSGLRENLADGCYLQRGLCNCHLYQQRKYVLRVSYLSMGDGTVYMYDDALGYGHAVPFDPEDKSWDCHVSHTYVPDQGKAGGFEGKSDGRLYWTLREQDFGMRAIHIVSTPLPPVQRM
jgi:hypothetical protein